MDCKVRRAEKRDFRALVRIADHLIHLDDWSRRERMLDKTLQDPDCDIYVAEMDGTPVGFVELRVFPDFVEGDHTALIQNLIVEKEHRRQGVGSCLVKRAFVEAERRNVKEIHVWTEFKNEPAIAFYMKHGFMKRALLFEREAAKE